MFRPQFPDQPNFPHGQNSNSQWQQQGQPQHQQGQPQYPQQYGQPVVPPHQQGTMAGYPMPQGNAGPGTRYTTWYEPLEGAFSAQMPEGWRTEGGMYRFSVRDVRAEVRCTSPDGQIYLFSGDRNVPAFSLPTQLGASLGMMEGSWYSPDGVAHYLILRYMPGAYFGQDYLYRTFGNSIANLQIRGTKDRPDLAAPQIQAAHQAGTQAEIHVSEMEFSGLSNGRPVSGYMMISTTLNSFAMFGMEGGMWYVTTLDGFIAEPSRAREAFIELEHLVASYQVNPQWQQQQNSASRQSHAMSRQSQQAAFESQQRNRQIMQETSEIIQQGYQSRQQSQDEVHRHSGNVLRGTTDVRDEITGDAYQVTAGSNYYWRKEGTDVIVGTDTHDAPGNDYRPVREF